MHPPIFLKTFSINFYAQTQEKHRKHPFSVLFSFVFSGIVLGISLHGYFKPQILKTRKPPALPGAFILSVNISINDTGASISVPISLKSNLKLQVRAATQSLKFCCYLIKQKSIALFYIFLKKHLPNSAKNDKISHRLLKMS